jgi:hypothetical protein
MTKTLLTLAFVAMLSSVSVAQHSDVEFGYDDIANPTAIIIENDETTIEDIQFFESEFEDEFNNGNFSSDEPGFATNDLESLLFNSGDAVSLRVLDASTVSSFGQGFVNFYDPTNDSLGASGRISVGNSAPGAPPAAIFDGATHDASSGVNLQLIETADDDGDIHNHLVFDLLDDATAPAGAYGLLVEVDATDTAGSTITSDAFWIIINHQLEEDVFETSALGAFGVTAVPEPASGAILIGIAGAILVRRRKRLA